jgi:hypothetical protein
MVLRDLHSLQAILEDVDAGVLTDVLSFVRETSPQTYVPIPNETHECMLTGSTVAMDASPRRWLRLGPMCLHLADCYHGLMTN